MRGGIQHGHSSRMRLRPLRAAGTGMPHASQAPRHQMFHETPEVRGERIREHPRHELNDRDTTGGQNARHCSSTSYETAEGLRVAQPSVNRVTGEAQQKTQPPTVQTLTQTPASGRRMTLDKLRRMQNDQIIKESLKPYTCESRPSSTAASSTSSPDFSSATFAGSSPKESKSSTMKESQTSKYFPEPEDTGHIIQPEGHKRLWSVFKLSRFAPRVKVHPSATTG